ncbi:DUF3431 domain-containing protein [bacterium]|nr:DUF3431 domain-containing protein [bacterium]NBX48956.1 DUF3431 domain-containing protein [bacterium]
MELCVSHYKEDLEWLKDFEGGVFVIDHDGADPSPFEPFATIPNSGYEASAYLKYIIERYDSLPDYVAFIHGHEEADHQLAGRPMLELIRTANIKKYGYVPLNNAWRNVLSITQLNGFGERWSQLFTAPMPDRFIVDTAAQFIVSKERILANRKSKYEFLYETIDTKDDATILEHMWHYIFGEPISMQPKKDLFQPPLDEIKLCNNQLGVGTFTVGFIGPKEFYEKLDFPTPTVHITTPEMYTAHKNNGTVFFRYIMTPPLDSEEAGGTCTVFNLTEAHAVYRVMQRESDLKAQSLLKI